MNTQRQLPAELANARPPTRQDAIERIRNRGQLGSRVIERFDDSLRGQQCARGTYTTQLCADYRREFEREREAAIADALLTLTHEYKALLDRKAQIDAANTQLLEAETATLRARYLTQPGATEDGFQKALPDLLEERRRRVALDGMTEKERMVEAMRGTVRI